MMHASAKFMPNRNCQYMWHLSVQSPIGLILVMRFGHVAETRCPEQQQTSGVNV